MTTPAAPPPCPWPAWLLLVAALLSTETARCYLAVFADLASFGLESLWERLRRG